MNTTEIIEIGSFKEKLVFDYFLVCHKDMDLEQRGALLKEQLGNDFLLLPRYSTVNDSGTRFDTSLCLIYTPASNYDEKKIFDKLRSISEPRIIITSYPVLNNGRKKMTEREYSRISEHGNYQYLIGYTFDNNEYTYHIAMGDSLGKIAKALVPQIKNITLDRMFSGRNNEGRHMFEFNKFKVRDYKIQGSTLVISNGTNTLDKISNNDIWSKFSQQTVIINVLPDYSYPMETSTDISGYYGMYELKQLTIIPQSLLVGLTTHGFTYKKKGKTVQSKQHMIPGSDDIELMAKIMRQYLSKGSLAAAQEYFNDKMTLRDVISTFNTTRNASDKKNLEAEYNRVVQAILACNREIATLTGDISEIETRSRDRLPIPKIIIEPEIVKNINITKMASNYGIQRSYCEYKGYLIPTKSLLRIENEMPVIKITQDILEGGN